MSESSYNSDSYRSQGQIPFDSRGEGSKDGILDWRSQNESCNSNRTRDSGRGVFYLCDPRHLNQTRLDNFTLLYTILLHLLWGPSCFYFEMRLRQQGKRGERGLSAVHFTLRDNTKRRNVSIDVAVYTCVHQPTVAFYNSTRDFLCTVGIITTTTNIVMSARKNIFT